MLRLEGKKTDEVTKIQSELNENAKKLVAVGVKLKKEEVEAFNAKYKKEWDPLETKILALLERTTKKITPSSMVRGTFDSLAGPNKVLYLSPAPGAPLPGFQPPAREIDAAAVRTSKEPELAAGWLGGLCGAGRTRRCT